MMSSDDNNLARYLASSAALIATIPLEPLYRMARQIYSAYQLDAATLVCGNGGSAATAQHIVCDLTKATRHLERKPFRAVCLMDNVAALTAWANDAAYETALASHLLSIARAGDILLLISASGRSPNVVQAALAAKERRMKVFALTGGDGGTVARLADLACIVPSTSAPLIEDAHLAIGHALTQALTEAIAR